ncbi:MAG: ATP-binding cassette domain-containing protein, partial [Deltaproteobacteria bacterium]|nr:ATP-binding cassette domain-containing protein [Deltaproteobacteria bacterium]
MSFLEVQGLTKAFTGLMAVNAVDMVLHKNEILGLIGPNGAGKTTFFNLLTGFLRPDQGRIRFKGEDLIGLKPFEICRRGMTRTFQIVQPFAN